MFRSDVPFLGLAQDGPGQGMLARRLQGRGTRRQFSLGVAIDWKDLLLTQFAFRWQGKHSTSWGCRRQAGHGKRRGGHCQGSRITQNKIRGTGTSVIMLSFHPFSLMTVEDSELFEK